MIRLLPLVALSAIAFLLPCPLYADDLRQSYPLLAKTDINALKEKAYHGDGEAQFNLATAYGRGLGVQINHNEAWDWIIKAANSGYAEAQYWLGYSYFYGYREKTNRTTALEWYKKSADQNFVNAQFMVAYILDSNEFKDIPRQPKAAVSWYSKAGNHGHAEAAFRLGCKSYFGMDVGKDLVIAKKWFKIAAKNGDPVAKEFITNKNDVILQSHCR